MPETLASPRLKITEIFRSLQGESSLSGRPTTFIRLTGCPLRCQYCDTAYAFHGGQWQALNDILGHPDVANADTVCVTGGEPLAQKPCADLLKGLCDAGKTVSLETSGALDITTVDQRVRRIVDIKTPGSGEQQRNRWENLDDLRSHDEIKFVICDRRDFDWAAEVVQERQLSGRCPVWFSPSFGQLPAGELADWLLQSGLPVRFQIQLHKILWGDEPGR